LRAMIGIDQTSVKLFLLLIQQLAPVFTLCSIGKSLPDR
jgi:hypothetical protein